MTMLFEGLHDSLFINLFLQAFKRPVYRFMFLQNYFCQTNPLEKFVNTLRQATYKVNFFLRIYTGVIPAIFSEAAPQEISGNPDFSYYLFLDPR